MNDADGAVVFLNFFGYCPIGRAQWILHVSLALRFVAAKHTATSQAF